jgi:hypothetical protein
MRRRHFVPETVSRCSCLAEPTKCRTPARIRPRTCYVTQAHFCGSSSGAADADGGVLSDGCARRIGTLYGGGSHVPIGSGGR